MNRIILYAGIALGAGIAGYFIYLSIVRKNIRERLDEALKNPEKAVGGVEKLLVSGAFDPNRYQKSGKATITLMEARERAKQVWENYSSWMASDQATIVSAFSGLGHFDDVSKISHEFQESYDKDLAEVLKSAIKDKMQLNLLVEKIGKLPKK